jgi:hypothetical protein
MRLLGFNLKEMHWSAFRSRNMFDRRYPLRRERFIFYQLAMILALVAECTATYSLSKYEDLQINMETLYTSQNGFPIQPPYERIHLYQNDLIDAQIITIVFCVLVACIFGADFFFLLFFPTRIYPMWYNVARRGMALIICAGLVAASLLSTVVVATRSAILSRSTREVYREAVEFFYRPPLRYASFPTNIAYVVMLWLATMSTFIA